MKMLAFFFTLMVPALGRLGETEAECEARYGTNRSTIGGEGTYEKNGIHISITFREGVAERIHFYKISDKFLGEPLTNSQIKELMAANLGGAKRWQSLDKNSTGERFTRDNGTAFAYWNFHSGTIEIITFKEKKREDDQIAAQRAADLAEKKRKEEALKKSTEGF